VKAVLVVLITALVLAFLILYAVNHRLRTLREILYQLHEYEDILMYHRLTDLEQDNMDSLCLQLETLL
jgi:hypothetical protein